MPSDKCVRMCFHGFCLHLDALLSSTDRRRRNLWTRPPQKKHRQLCVQLQLVLRVELHVLCMSVELSIFYTLFLFLHTDLLLQRALRFLTKEADR